MDQPLHDFTTFVNPADLQNNGDFHDTDFFPQFAYQTSLQADAVLPAFHDRTSRSQDSAVDLTTFQASYQSIKQDVDFSNFLDTSYSPPASSTPSPPGNDAVFSTANSPRDYRGHFRDQSQTSSPETSNDSMNNDLWPAIAIPQSTDPVKVAIHLDKTKTRAETQIKTQITMHPLPAHYQWVRFPRHTLSKSKQLATEEEAEINESKDSTVRLQLTLVLATAVEKPDGLERAYRRARGAEPTPQRKRETAVTEIDKSDPAHPQNGGAVMICEGCKEREAKRYNRKKKRNADEEKEWNSYEDQRIIMINEKEFKRWQDADEDRDHPTDAKKVEFVMRITCYCRHQEDKSPVGYRVVFTFTDKSDNVLAQEISDIIQITDDHKNKESPAETMGPLLIPTGPQDPVPSQYNVPMYDYSPTVYTGFSLPSTPVVSQTPGIPHSQSMFFPREAQYPRMVNHVVTSQAGMSFNANVPAPAPAPQYPTHQRGQSYFMPTMLSPKAEQMAQSGFPLQRPQSLDSFSQWNFQFPHQASYTQPHVFASQPPSRAPSRPASPTWGDGRGAKKMRGPGGFELYDYDEE
ncbi:SPT3 Dosage dependent suppressor of Ty-induced promoter mutations-like protein [Coniothyrium glycines]